MDRQSETVQFLDNMDIALSLDNRPEENKLRTSIELTLQQIVLRASYRDILLVNSIAQRAIELSNKAASSPSPITAVSKGVPGPEGKAPSITTSAVPRPGTLANSENVCDFAFRKLPLT